MTESDGRTRIVCPQCGKTNAVVTSALQSAIREGQPFTCAACGKPLPLPIVRNRIPMSTTDTIPGVEPVSFVSLITATAELDASIGDRKRSENQLRNQLLADVLDQLAEAALLLGGNAVTGVTLIWAAGNVGGGSIGAAAGRGDKVTLIALGNAVTAGSRDS